jgi:hypothetical protein
MWMPVWFAKLIAIFVILTRATILHAMSVLMALFQQERHVLLVHQIAPPVFNRPHNVPVAQLVKGF